MKNIYIKYSFRHFHLGRAFVQAYLQLGTMAIKQSTTMFGKYYYALTATLLASVALEATLTSATSSSMTSITGAKIISHDAYNNNPSFSGSNEGWAPIQPQSQIMTARKSSSSVMHTSLESQMPLSDQAKSKRRRTTLDRLPSLSCKDLAFITSFPNLQPANEQNILHKICHHHHPTTNPASKTILHMSSPPSSRQQSYGKSYGGNAQQQQNTRNRGANAADRNRRGHSFRQEGTEFRRRKSPNTKRPPRWEREGDNLYAEVTKQLDAYTKGGGANNNGEEDDNNDDAMSAHLLALTKEKIETAEDVCRLLGPWTATKEELQRMKERQRLKEERQKASAAAAKEKEQRETPVPEEKPKGKGPPFLWGSLPVGPVLASRLRATGRDEPTPVQRAAFKILTEGLNKDSRKKKKNNEPTKRSNAIIASPTGTGKTLAYLLPLLCTSPGGQNGEGTGGVVIVTPTIELACQIQREVDVLWPSDGGEEEDAAAASSCFVVGVDDGNAQDGEPTDDDDDDDDWDSPGRKTLIAIKNAPFIAGTPKMLRALYKEASRIVLDGKARHYSEIDPTISLEERAAAKALVDNLRAVVLDEADRLLRTEAVARETTERKMRKLAERRAEEAARAAAKERHSKPIKKAKQKRLVVARQTQTELLLRDLPVYSLDDVQIICASATIGRTMRRQLMQILDAPSADAAATLVTGDTDDRVKSKNAERRKSVLLPEGLKHGYCVVVEDEDDGGAKDNDGLFEELLLKMTASERNEERRVKATIHALWGTMTSLEEAKPILVFPGRVGVERVQKELIARGLSDVRTLRNLDGKTPEADVQIEALDDVPNNVEHGWGSTPVYIIGERFARGLDLPDVKYVFMLSPPSSAAGYAHMSGRTGRNGNEGTAITLVKAKNNEVSRLAAIAEALGLKFDASVSGVAGGGGVEQSLLAPEEETIITPEILNEEGHECDTVAVTELPEESAPSSSSSYPWILLSESAISRKKNAELYEYLLSFGNGSETINKRSKKAELVEAIQGLHANAVD